MITFTISTNVKQQCIDITDKVQEIVKQSNIKDGICFLYTPHATGGIIINENWDPNIGNDFIKAVSDIIPQGIWQHDRIDNNGAAHIKSSLIGPSEYIPIKNNRLQLGQWQNIMFTEFDGPKSKRTINISLLNI
jgi:secondary thiamine-phosphate synthase enzyme